MKGDETMARRKDRTRQQSRDAVNTEHLAGAAVADPAGSLPFKTATYARLSVDSSVTESDSIAGQQMLMRDYIKDRDEFLLVKEYKDDGISGTRFDRRAFDSLLVEVRKGNINCIIVKDFSRFGRDHIEVGDYLEKIFPFLGVRFISVNDGYDSFERDSADKKLTVILKNLVNESIARDISVKVASCYAVKQENGEYDGGRAPYGYAFADERKTRFLVDAGPAEVIRDIFAWTIQGDSALTIVRRLTENRINPPKAYQDTGEFFRQEKERRYWNEYTVNAILRNRAYAGHMVLHKGRESKADGLSPCRLEESAWKITKNTHEAIVTEHDFGLVQEILRERKERHRTRNASEETVIRPENLLKGKVFCGDCLVPASRMGTNYRRKSGKVRIYRYRCRTYREKGVGECSSKSIAEKDLEALVFPAVTVCIRRMECPEDSILRFHSEFFRKLRKEIEKEKDAADRAIRQKKNEKIILYQEYGRVHRRTEDDRTAYDKIHCRTEDDRTECDGTEYDKIHRSDRMYDGMTEHDVQNKTSYNSMWYLKEKQKKDREIRCQEEKKAQLEEKAAFYERQEKEQAGRIKEILAYGNITADRKEEKLTAQMVSSFVDKIFLYDGKRVEIVLNFKKEE